MQNVILYCTVQYSRLQYCGCGIFGPLPLLELEADLEPKSEALKGRMPLRRMNPTTETVHIRSLTQRSPSARGCPRKRKSGKGGFLDHPFFGHQNEEMKSANHRHFLKGTGVAAACSTPGAAGARVWEHQLNSISNTFRAWFWCSLPDPVLRGARGSPTVALLPFP